MRKFFQILLAATVLLTFSLTMAFETNDYIEYESVLEPVPGQNGNQMKRMAVIAAYQALAEEVSTVYVTSDSTVKNLCELDETVNVKVQAALRGRKLVSEFKDAEGNYHAILRLPIYGGSGSLASAVLNEKVVVEDFPKPKTTNIISKADYTGLVVDCRGLNLSQAITPVIKSDDSTEIYAYKNLGYQAAVDKGIVEYSSTIDSPRAGSSPLVIKAIKISGTCDVVVSAQDADKILTANQSAKFLDNCAVVLVR